MRAQLIKIGNSRGIRLPRSVIEDADLGDELNVVVERGAVVIRAVVAPRKGWAEDAKACRNNADDALGDWDSAIADGDWE
jgi:antitoxin MazE